VISTDNKSSTVYIFKPADSLDDQENNYTICLDSFDKNTDHAKKAKTLAEQIYKIKQRPEVFDEGIPPKIEPYK
jgi:hypothetical protein